MSTEGGATGLNLSVLFFLLDEILLLVCLYGNETIARFPRAGEKSTSRKFKYDNYPTGILIIADVYCVSFIKGR